MIVWCEGVPHLALVGAAVQEPISSGTGLEHPFRDNCSSTISIAALGLVSPAVTLAAEVVPAAAIATVIAVLATADITAVLLMRVEGYCWWVPQSSP